VALYVILEGGPGVGKTSVAEALAAKLRGLGFRACIVDDAMRGIAPVLDRLFGRWYRAPRELAEYMFLGYQLRRIHECLRDGADILILDYSVESPLAYMEADGIPYPQQLESLAEAVLPKGRVAVFILEHPTSYQADAVRWEDPRRAQSYSRKLIARAVSLAARLDARVYVIPERRSVDERVNLILKLLTEDVAMGREAPGPSSPVARGPQDGPEQAPRGSGRTYVLVQGN
jgi:thymidylate kinase